MVITFQIILRSRFVISTSQSKIPHKMAVFKSRNSPLSNRSFSKPPLLTVGTLRSRLSVPRYSSDFFSVGERHKNEVAKEFHI